MLQPDILATIKFFSTEEGGRNGPIIRTLGFIFGYQNELFDCRILLKDGEIINPGETKMFAPIKFLCPHLIKPLLKKGSKFILKDYRIVAEGEVQVIF